MSALLRRYILTLHLMGTVSDTVWKDPVGVTQIIEKGV